MGRLNGKVALIRAAVRGMGRAEARHFSAEAARVATAFGTLNVLVNNAGIAESAPACRSATGKRIAFATNETGVTT